MAQERAGVHVPSTGAQFLLEHEGQRAVVTEVGATLRSWRVDEREQLDTFEVDEVGDGFHPSITLAGARLEDALLELPARSRVPVDDRLLPTGAPIPVDGTEYDFRRPRPLGQLALDTCFGDLERGPDGLARATLVARADERAVTVWMDERFRFIHVYTSDATKGPSRRSAGVAVEPMTCAPDAFNTGDGLLALVPGASFAGRWGLNTQREVQ